MKSALRSGWWIVCSLLFALPLESIAQNYSRMEYIVYHDNLPKWVLGQTAGVTCMAAVPVSTACDGDIITEITYDTNAQPITVGNFGKLRQTLTYNADGTIATVKDGNNNMITLTNWKRGIPQSIQHPITPESPAGATESAYVNDHGWIEWVKDENNFQTNYAYDPMGRLKKIVWPTGDSTAWNDWNADFRPLTTADWRPLGVVTGQWRHAESYGNYRKITYYDALWRPVITSEYDESDAAATLGVTNVAYDHEGRVVFGSYPNSTFGSTIGIRTTYDTLGRVIQVKQDWEGVDQLTMTTEYLSGFQARITNPRNQQTTTSYLAWDQPTYDFPVAVVHPAGIFTDIARDVFGKPTQLSRHNADNSTSQQRYFYYDAHQLLCKSKETETGVTAYGYDGAGNLAWSASGLPWSSDPTCEYTAATAAARRVDRTYDARNRLKTLTFPDNRGNQTWTYTPDGLPATISTVQAGVTAPTLNTYTYNRRRLLTSESQTPYAWETWTLVHNYNANGHLSDTTYPFGLNVAYAPNALGQPTQAGSYATGVRYFPNGAIKQFTYGNGIVHTLTQNARGLPDTSCDFYGACDASAILNDGYDYDQNANVAAISDGLTGSRGNRAMTYDGLDRLTQVISPMFGAAAYAYDALDNLTRVTVGATAMRAARDHFYCYDASWRLTNVKTGSCSGATVTGLGYDVQGNLANKDGVIHEFDYGNRLRRISTGRHYMYDGHGRRVIETVGTMNPQRRRFMYGIDGRLMYESQSSNSNTESIHLGGSLVARKSRPIASPYPSDSVTYQHTDTLGNL